jgi:hypothetical protein
MRKDHSELVLLVPLFPIFLLGMLPMLLFPLLGFAGLAVIGALVIACGFGEYGRAMAEYNEDVIVRGYLARSDQGRHLLSSLKSASRLAKGLIAAGVGIACIAIAGLCITF